MRMRHRSAVGTGTGPLDFAGGIGLLLPDRNTGLDGIDEETVCLKSGFAMGGCSQSDDCAFSNFKGPNPMDGEGLDHGKLLHCFSDNTLPFFLRENRMMGVMELFNITALVVIANQTLENDEGSAGRISHLLTQRGEIERSVLNGEHGGLPAGEGRHKGDGLIRRKEIGPFRELIVDRRFDVRKIE